MHETLGRCTMNPGATKAFYIFGNMEFNIGNLNICQGAASCVILTKELWKFLHCVFASFKNYGC